MLPHEPLIALGKIATTVPNGATGSVGAGDGEGATGGVLVATGGNGVGVLFGVGGLFGVGEGVGVFAGLAVVVGDGVADFHTVGVGVRVIMGGVGVGAKGVIEATGQGTNHMLPHSLHPQITATPASNDDAIAPRKNRPTQCLMFVSS